MTNTKTIRLSRTLITGTPVQGPLGMTGLIENPPWTDVTVEAKEANRLLALFGGQELVGERWVDVAQVDNGTLLSPAIGGSQRAA
ncbi:hypothetical protein [Lichenifustis flavocetrariae]|uniref:Uncharacterized protein n=1 Tax=Lichenifustis flavocetrariae TaxID=2949735 RepID=A0AA41Z532_9HYPH|nr:hypothetical protein [Lichenifustis flavocetrariae]MCW6513108.1 hypothetical protein [Lichenifustis flavocetrariae]